MQARRINLRDYQQHLVDRITGMAAAGTASSHLGFEVNQQRWVIPLTEVSEVIPLPQVASVPLTQDWFLGVANVRGGLYAISDFAHFMTGSATIITHESRLVLLNGKYRAHAGLLICRSLGLRAMRDAEEANGITPPWQGATYRDAQDLAWKELSVERLVRDPRFLSAAQYGFCRKGPTQGFPVSGEHQWLRSCPPSSFLP